MQRFFFDVQNGDRYSRDDSGIHLPHVNCIWQIAVVMADDVANAQGLVGPPQAVSVVVRDASGVVVYRSECAGHQDLTESMTKPLLSPFAGRGEARG